MKLPRDLSGAELIKLLCKHYDYRRVNQEGSHVILETNAILRAVANVQGVEKEDILRRL